MSDFSRSMSEATLMTYSKMLKMCRKTQQQDAREWGTESNVNLQHLFIPSKTAILVPEFTAEDLPLDKTPTLVPAFAVKDLPLGNTL